MELNKVYEGDCMKLSKQMPDEHIDLVVTSPPYADTVSYGSGVNVFHPDNYSDWILPLFEESSRFLKKTGSFILNINDRILNGSRSIYVMETVIDIVRKTDLKLFDRYIWHKKSTLPVHGDRRFNDRVEYIFHFVRDVKNFKSNMDDVRVPYKDISLRRFKNKMHGNDKVNEDGTTSLSDRGESKANVIGTKPTTVFQFDTCSALRGIDHPAPFHPQIPNFFIKWLTDEDDVVLDPFMGGGTTAESAMKLNRKWIGMELNPKYIEMSNKRLKSSKMEYKIKQKSKNFWE